MKNMILHKKVKSVAPESDYNGVALFTFSLELWINLYRARIRLISVRKHNLTSSSIKYQT